MARGDRKRLDVLYLFLLIGYASRMVDSLPYQAKKGRGAVSNATGRFEPHARIAVDDGWVLDGDEDAPPKLRTEVTPEQVKSALTRNASPDIPFDRSLNPYRGCEHGCVYCYARPSHAYMNLSPGLDFESKLFVKANMVDVLEEQLRAPGYTPAPVMIGANTDPYQPIEREHRLTRRILELLYTYRHPAVVITKNHLIARDVDVLAEMARLRLVSVGISLTTLDGELARTMEPRASTPAKRLAAMRVLADANVPVTVMAAPMIPMLNDHELERILTASREAGAQTAAYILLRLPLELKDLFAEWLETHAPGKAKRVMNLLRQSRDGQLYISEFGTRMTGVGVHAKLLNKRYHLACKKLGLRPAEPGPFKLRCDLFRRPVRIGDQLELL